MTTRRGVFWPLLLIAIGLLFLLSNFGLISGVSWLAVLSLWPLLLILIGLDIAFARRWPLPALAAELLVIVAGLALVAASPNFRGVPFAFSSGGRGQTEVSAARGEVRTLTLTINGGAGRYRVGAGSSDLVSAHSQNPDLRLRTTNRSDRADVHIDQVGPEGFLRGPDTDIEVRINVDVPTSFEMNAGAGEFYVDLAEVRVTDARVNTGAASLRLSLPKPSGDVPVRLNAGASSIVVTVPEAVEARISTTGGLLTLRSENSRLSQGSDGGGCIACGSSVETPGYATAKDRLTVTISAGASSIVVR